MSASAVVSPLSALHFPAHLSTLFGPLQLLGYLACGIGFTAFFAVSQRRFMMIGATSAVLWTLHYHFLGERVAAALSAISGGRNTIAVHVQSMSRRVRVGVTVFICLLVATLAIWAGSGPLAALPTFAACLTTTANFWFAGKTFRRAYLVSDACWIAFGLLAGTAAGCIAATISFCLNLWTLKRYVAATTPQPAATPAVA